ncbi:hypothetical protein K402DRAFT_36691 [Aulographum hederae CBS 113979]|uniref:Uncharacterized protein n=1 Tax=Aulographum hederae CBS 113979 TaxID=1176131 RepID=A0A6G1H4I8_9PEZI|nr:hypothetical protein K402DRAFT_36691 [Aulographum hederae CBS 113979]
MMLFLPQARARARASAPARYLARRRLVCRPIRRTPGPSLPYLTYKSFRPRYRAAALNKTPRLPDSQTPILPVLLYLHRVSVCPSYAAFSLSSSRPIDLSPGAIGERAYSILLPTTTTAPTTRQVEVAASIIIAESCVRRASTTATARRSSWSPTAHCLLESVESVESGLIPSSRRSLRILPAPLPGAAV